jgi:FSR family fosmidomycin resistance protein-like MFS transporter
LGDRVGPLWIIRSSFLLVPSLILAFVNAQTITASVALLFPLGFALFISGSVLVVLGQEYLPNRVGTAAGVTIGLAVSVGGMVAPLLGKAADTYGLVVVFWALSAAAAVAAVLGLLLPRAVTSPVGVR